MPRLFSILLAAVLAWSAPSAQAQSAPDGLANELLRQFDSSMEKFIALADAMPASVYGWSPGPGVMTVARVYTHVIRYNYLYPATSLGVPAPISRDSDATEEIRDKARIVAMLRESREHVRGVVGKLPPDLAASTKLYGREVSQAAVLLQLVAHMNEHLGQSIAYARMNKIVPPWTR
ncbi:MAG: DinB family protein [Gemmatimonadales bacterium]